MYNLSNSQKIASAPKDSLSPAPLVSIQVVPSRTVSQQHVRWANSLKHNQGRNRRKEKMTSVLFEKCTAMQLALMGALLTSTVIAVVVTTLVIVGG